MPPVPYSSMISTVFKNFIKYGTCLTCVCTVKVFLHVSLVRVKGKVMGYLNQQIGIIEVSTVKMGALSAKAESSSPKKGVKDSNIRASYQKEKLKLSVRPSSTG